MKKKTNFLRIVARTLVLAMLITSAPMVTPSTKQAKAAVSSNSVIYDGEGEISQTLANGKVAKTSIHNGVVSITVDDEKFAYESGVTAFTAVYGPDDILHLFWGTGRYDWYDLYENGKFGTCYKLFSSQMYCSQDYAGTNLAYAVIGNSTANVNFHSCIWDSQYFFQEGKNGKKRLITRAEIEAFDGDPTPAPTATPTAAPATQEPRSIETPAPATAAPATAAPATAAPATAAPATQAPADGNAVVDNSGNANGDDSTANGGNGQNANPVINGDGNVVNIDQTIIINNNEINGNNNNVSNDASDDDVNNDTAVTGDNNNTSADAEESKVEDETQVSGDNNKVDTDAEQTKSDAKAETQQTGNGGGNTATTKADSAAASNGAKASAKTTKKSSSKKFYYVIRKGKQVRLARRSGGKSGVISRVVFYKKKGVARFDGIRYTKIKYVGFTQKSHMIIMIKKNNKVIIIPRGKGKIGKTYKAKVLKGKWSRAAEDTAGLTIRVVNKKAKKVKGVKSAQPTRLK